MKCPLCETELTPAALEDFICPTSASFSKNKFKESHYSMHTANQLQICNIPPFKLTIMNGKSHLYVYSQDIENFKTPPIVINQELPLDSSDKLLARLKMLATFS